MRGRKPGITKAGENKKTALIKTATKLFAEKGYYHTTLDEIAMELGITKAALYYYIRNKEDVLREIINISMAQMDELISIGKTGLSAKDKLRQFVFYHVECGSQSGDESKILFEQADALPKRTHDAIKQKKRQVDMTLQNILKEGIEEGSFNKFDIKIISYAIIGLCTWIYHWYQPNGRLKPKKIAEIFLNFLYNSILCK